MKGFVWQELNPDDTEAFLAGMLVEMYPGAYRTDGRGGDGSVDVAWPSPEGLVIFQIKAFSMPLGPSQKRQILKSLATAEASHGPRRWVLVMPLDFTSNAQKWFDDVLRLNGHCVTDFMGLASVEAELAKRPHLLRAHVHSLREQTLAVVAEYGAEKAVLANGMPDAMERNRKLLALADHLDPDFRFRMCVDATSQSVELIPRHADALKNRPIKGSFQLNVSLETDAGKEFATAFQDVSV